MFDFHFFPTNAMCLIPMKFSIANPAALKLDLCDTFELSPAGLSELFAQPHIIPYSSTCGNDLYAFNIADQIKIHSGTIVLIISFTAYHSNPNKAERF